MMRKVLILLIFFTHLSPVISVLFGFELREPLYKYISKEYTTSSGLPHNTIYAITQDKDGFIWIGTDRGLVRHGGRNFDIFSSKNTSEIQDDSITSIVKDGNGGLWIASYSGGVIHYSNEKFTGPIFPGNNKSTLIWRLFLGKDKGLWIGTIGEGLIYFKDGIRKKISFPKGPARNIRAIINWSGNRLLIGTESGLFLKNNKLGKVEAISKQDIFIMSLFREVNKGLWIGTDKDLLFGTISGGKLKIIRRIEEGNIIRDIKRFEKSIWIASEDGLKRIDSVKSVSVGFRTDYFYNPLITLFKDRENILWAGSAGRGLGKIQKRTIFVLKENNSFGRYDINSVLNDNSGRLWIGTNKRGLYKLEKKSLLSIDSKILPSKKILSIYQSLHNDIWIGTQNGLFLIEKGEINKIKIPLPLLKSEVLSINEDFSGNIIFGLKSGGVIIKEYLGRGQSFKHYLSDLSVYTIRRTPDNKIWFGTNRGIWTLGKNKKIIKNVYPEIKNENIFDIYIETEKIKWIAAGKNGFYGIINNKLINFYKMSTIQGQKFFRVMKDKNNLIWISTDNGIISVKRRELLGYRKAKNSIVNFNIYGTDEGMTSSVCKGGSQPAGTITKSGILFFPTRTGLVYLDSSNLIINSVTPNIKLSEFYANGKLIKIKKQIKLPSGTNRIFVKINVISLFNPKKIRIRFRLLHERISIDKISKINTISYENLLPGKYQLYISAGNESGIWNFKGKSIKFNIKHYFYQTSGFQMLLIIFTFLLIISTFRIINKIKIKRTKNNIKYKNSNITTIDIQLYITKLKKTVEKEKLFLDPNIKLIDISSRMGIPRKLLSQLINEVFNENFKSFLNKYRIEYAKKLMADPSLKGISLLRISYESGFNSKSVFNSVFKKFTGMIPSEFRKKNKMY